MSESKAGAYLTGASLMVLPSNIRLALKDLQGTNTLAYFTASSKTKNVFSTLPLANRMLWEKNL
jgi:hypothetical protein